MVIARLAIALAATGCLSKPAIPSDGGSDAPIDGAMTDAFVYAGCTPLPSTFVLRSVPVIANFDRRDGTISEDLITYGLDMTNGGAYVYLTYGGTAFDPNCYHRRLQFEVETGIVPLDVFVGEVTGDTNLDVVLYGREVAPTVGPQHEVLVFPGDASGTLRATGVLKKFPVVNPFDDAWGGDADSQEPVYLVATTQTGATQVANLFVGGLYNWKAEIGVTPDPGLGAVSKVTGTDNMFLIGSSQPVQDVEPYGVGDPSQLIVITQGEVVRVQSNNVRTGGNSQYQILSSTSLPGAQQRSARFVRGKVGGATLGVTQNGSLGYTVFQVTGTGAEPAVIAPFDVSGTGIDPFHTTDMAIGNLDGDTRLELVAITDDSSNAAPPVLRVYTNLVISGTSQVGYGFIHELTLPRDYKVLGVGDFDGVAATSPRILVFSVVAGMPVLCFELRTSSIAVCGA